MSRRILILLGNSQIPRCFDDWYDFADYVKQENLAGRDVIVKRWEYV